MNYINLGCGRRFHSVWTNLDFVSTDADVIAYDITQGIPFADVSFDVVYHSHLLEHLSRQQAEFLLRECYRVLRPKSVLRVVVPDLEQIARTYLIALEQASSSSQEWAANYEWILLEMYDQTVREHSGGKMAEYLTRQNIPNVEFILNRCGMEAKNLIEAGCQQREQREQHQPDQVQDAKLIDLLKQIYRFFRYPNYRRESLLKLLLNKEYTALQIGRFRQSGEVHQWMYDRYSLGLLLEKAGFEAITQRAATESYILDWASFNLDTEPDGTVYKPDSLYMEAIKPVI